MAMLVSIDNGGTLTDACVIYGAKVFHAKTLTTPHDLTKCFIEVLREVSTRVYGEPKLQTLLEEVDYIRYSTTQGTNAVVQRKGPRLGLVLRKGSKADKLMRNDGERELAQALIGDRVATIDMTLDDEKLDLALTGVINDLISRGANRLVVSLGGADLAEAETRLKRLVLLRYPRHLLGAVPLLYSHQLSDDRDDARRTWSSLLNAFLHPAMERFLYGAENVLREARARNPMLIFGNDGTSSRVAKTIALKTWGSGPRGGMEGARALAVHYNRNRLVTMDIGGTTTDIGLVDRGAVRERRYGTLEDVEISFPLSEVESLGAGGSSVCTVADGKVRIGPESVGGAPGPACFGYGGTSATMTDAYLLLGLLDGDSYFGGSLKLDPARAQAAIEAGIARPLGIGLDEALARMEQAYVAKIAAAMKPLADKAGETTLLAFGGAGPMTACRIADSLSIAEIIVPRMAAVFSAFGIGFSDIAHSYEARLTETSEKGLSAVLDLLRKRARSDMFAEGFDLDECAVEKALEFSQNGEVVTRRLNGELKGGEGLQSATDLRVQMRATKTIPHFGLKAVDTKAGKAAASSATRALRLIAADCKSLAAARALPLYQLEKMAAGDHATGPAVIEEPYFTCLVLEGWSFLVNDNHDLVLKRAK